MLSWVALGDLVAPLGLSWAALRALLAALWLLLGGSSESLDFSWAALGLLLGLPFSALGANRRQGSRKVP